MNYVNDAAIDTGMGFTEVSNVFSTEYSYDKNGNLTKDLNKDITEIAYNLLNLPKRVLKGGHVIQYIYTATGEKLQNKLEGKTINYNGGFSSYTGDSINFDNSFEGQGTKGIEIDFIIGIGANRSLSDKHNRVL